MVIKQMVLAAGDLGEAVHGFLHDPGEPHIVGVHGLAALEIDVGILRGATEGGVVGRHGPGAEGGEVRLVQHGTQVVVGEQRELGNLVGGAEAVEEVDEGHAGAVTGDVRHEGEVVGFLAGIAAQQGATGGAAGHDILVVAEDRESLGGECPRAHMDREGEEFARDLVEVGDHQQETLRGGKGGGQGASQQAAMDSAGDAALGLELNDPRHLAPEVEFAQGGPFVTRLGHGRGRRDRVDGDQLI